MFNLYFKNIADLKLVFQNNLKLFSQIQVTTTSTQYVNIIKLNKNIVKTGKRYTFIDEFKVENV